MLFSLVPTYALFQNVSALYAFHAIKIIISIVLRWFSDACTVRFVLSNFDRYASVTQIMNSLG